MTQDPFTLVGIRPEEPQAMPSKKKTGFPFLSVLVLLLIVLGCVFAGVIAQKDPAFLDLANYSKSPDREFLFGTDTLGRDIFSCIWYGRSVILNMSSLPGAWAEAFCISCRKRAFCTSEFLP